MGGAGEDEVTDEGVDDGDEGEWVVWLEGWERVDV